MAIIVTQTADTAYHIRNAFRRFERDAYPLGVVICLKVNCATIQNLMTQKHLPNIYKTVQRCCTMTMKQCGICHIKLMNGIYG